MTEPESPADAALRDPASVFNLTAASDWWRPSALDYTVQGPFWDILEARCLTVLVTREYEHFVLALSADHDGPRVSVLRAPHPSGLVVDRTNDLVHIACTRNPNQVLRLGLSNGWLDRSDRPSEPAERGLVPHSTTFHPGCLYLHDLAIVDGRLLGTAVGMNTVVDLQDGLARPVWWPASIGSRDGPLTDRNHIQLNSIAAGSTIAGSYFTASMAAPGPTRPGDPDWEVDRAGVIFDGMTREPLVGGLTRPHSVRNDRARLFVADSGYGDLCLVDAGELTRIANLPGWTRGLCILDDLALVGTSRIIRRTAQYAPGIDVDRARCAIHLVDLEGGGIEGSLIWPEGDQIFGIDWIARERCRGFLAGRPGLDAAAVESAWYRYAPPVPRDHVGDETASGGEKESDD